MSAYTRGYDNALFLLVSMLKDQMMGYSECATVMEDLIMDAPVARDEYQRGFYSAVRIIFTLTDKLDRDSLINSIATALKQ